MPRSPWLLRKQNAGQRNFRDRLLAFPRILMQARCADSNNPPEIGEQIFVKSCQSALLLLTEGLPWQDTRRIKRFLACQGNRKQNIKGI
jgi:hypothetical protein